MGLTPAHYCLFSSLRLRFPRACIAFEGKCNYRDVLAKLKSNLSADTSQVLDGLLVELKVNGE